MRDIKLTYFDFDGGRGEDCRLALHLAGVPFTDERVLGKTWAERKATTPFGALPVLQVDGRVLSSSNAILGWIGETYGLLPEDPWERACHLAVLDCAEDLRKAAERTHRDDEEAKLVARGEFAAGYLRSWLGAMSDQIGDGPFLAGDAPGVADLKLFVMLGAYARGVFDGIPDTVLVDFPKLVRLLDAAAAHPRVRSWYDEVRASE